MAHWYGSDGSPRHFEGKDGAGTTLREARKLTLFPSVTTIGGIKYRFGLEQWKLETVCKYALTRDAGSDVKDVCRLAFEELDKQADAGTDIHDVLEHFHADPDCSAARMNAPMCEAIKALIHDRTGMDFHADFRSEVRFCDTTLGYAGMCDLHNEHWIIDYKSKDTVDAKTKGWKEQAEQLAAYAYGLGFPNARLVNIFISRADPTQVIWYEHKDDMAWQRFLHTLRLWQVENKYGPYFDGLEEDKP